jgi:hypothetical protein
MLWDGLAITYFNHFQIFITTNTFRNAINLKTSGLHCTDNYSIFSSISLYLGPFVQSQPLLAVQKKNLYVTTMITNHSQLLTTTKLRGFSPQANYTD